VAEIFIDKLDDVVVKAVVENPIEARAERFPTCQLRTRSGNMKPMAIEVDDDALVFSHNIPDHKNNLRYALSEVQCIKEVSR